MLSLRIPTYRQKGFIEKSSKHDCSWSIGTAYGLSEDLLVRYCIIFSCWSSQKGVKWKGFNQRCWDFHYLWVNNRQIVVDFFTEGWEDLVNNLQTQQMRAARFQIAVNMCRLKAIHKSMFWYKELSQRRKQNTFDFTMLLFFRITSH